MAPERSLEGEPEDFIVSQVDEETVQEMKYTNSAALLSANWKDQAYLKLRNTSVSPEPEDEEIIRIDIGDDNSITPNDPSGNALRRFLLMCDKKLKKLGF